MSAAVEQSRRKANLVSQGDWKFGPEAVFLDFLKSCGQT